jgi:Zn-dependent peptidase ImmA (M78 family)
VTTWADAHARAAVQASQLHAALGVALDRPVDVFAAAQALGIVLAFDNLGDTSGLYLPASSAQPHAGILINSQHPRSRQRYTCGHELGHHAFGHHFERDGDLEGELAQALERGTLERWSDAEKEAEAFGAWFLMPRRLLRTGLKQQGLRQPRHPLDVYALALWLGTSYSATARHLGNTRLVDPNLANQWARLTPRALKAALSEGLAVTSYRNDVWWLDEHAHRQPMDLRPGDRLILNLPEDPSTGYSWTLDILPEPLRLVADSFHDDYEPPLDSSWTPLLPGLRGAQVLTHDQTAGASAPDEIAGGAIPRAFVLDLDSAAEAGIYHLMLRYRREWEDQPVREFELLLSVSPALYGVQLRPDQLALRS